MYHGIMEGHADVKNDIEDIKWKKQVIKFVVDCHFLEHVWLGKKGNIPKC